MKKSLLALAALGAFASVAQAQSAVTIYGLVDAGITRETGGASGSQWKMTTGAQSGNRLGFKGTEDLGSGLKANFQIENGFNLDTGSQRQGALFGRQAWVGLSGDFGSVSLGRQYNPFFGALDSIDPFGTGTTGATTNLMAGSSVRTNNSIKYNTPGMSGFSASLLYGFGEVPGNTAKSRTYSLSLDYANGPIAGTLSYDRVNNAADTDATKLFLLGGAYDFGAAKLFLGYETEKTNSESYRDFMIGVSAPVGTGTVLASYINQKDRISGSNQAGKQYAIGYLHPMSKRTNLYATYGRITNDSRGFNIVGNASDGGPADQAMGASSSGLSFGIRHKF